MHKVFKADRRNDSIRCAYLYADGHVVVMFERRELGTSIQYVKIAQSVGIRACFKAGRIVFHDTAALAAISMLPEPQVSVYLDNYSNVSREKGIRVDTVSVRSAVGHMSLHDCDVIGGSVHIQVGEQFDRADYENAYNAEQETWSDYRVVKVYPNVAA